MRPTGKGLNSEFNSLSAEECSQLFDTLEQWERYVKAGDKLVSGIGRLICPSRRKTPQISP